MPKKQMTKAEACEMVAASLREYGYPTVTREMVEEVLDAWLTGARYPDLPHGVVGAFAAEQFKDVAERGADLSKLQ